MCEAGPTVLGPFWNTGRATAGVGRTSSATAGVASAAVAGAADSSGRAAAAAAEALAMAFWLRSSMWASPKTMYVSEPGLFITSGFFTTKST